ncbi:MAG: nucleotidyltransferase domain-containing protein [Planctomycetes bacterium]|nr:nucleotidyltransferase domain-containing protein [Planctomycetota bacterium]
MDRATLIEALRSYFAGRPDVVAAYLFGSTARGEAKASSDVDVGVLLAAGEPSLPADYDVLFAIQDDLEERLHRPVDVLAMNGAPLDLLHRVLRDGILVLDRDPLRRGEFELAARTQYMDFLPVLLRYRSMVLRGA